MKKRMGESRGNFLSSTFTRFVGYALGQSYMILICVVDVATDKKLSSNLHRRLLFFLPLSILIFAEICCKMNWTPENVLYNNNNWGMIVACAVTWKKPLT